MWLSGLLYNTADRAEPSGGQPPNAARRSIVVSPLGLGWQIGQKPNLLLTRFRGRAERLRIQTPLRIPERTAVKTNTVMLTYDGLNKAANRVAAAVLSLGVPAEQPIALFLDHDATMIASVLGVLKAGNV